MKFSEPQPYKPYTVCMSVLIQTCELNFNPQIISQAIYLPISVKLPLPSGTEISQLEDWPIAYALTCKYLKPIRYDIMYVQYCHHVEQTTAVTYSYSYTCMNCTIKLVSLKFTYFLVFPDTFETACLHVLAPVSQPVTGSYQITNISIMKVLFFLQTSPIHISYFKGLVVII